MLVAVEVKNQLPCHSAQLHFQPMELRGPGNSEFARQEQTPEELVHQKEDENLTHQYQKKH